MFKVGDFIRLKINLHPMNAGAVGMICYVDHPMYHARFKRDNFSTIEIGVKFDEMEDAAQTITDASLSVILANQSNDKKVKQLEFWEMKPDTDNFLWSEDKKKKWKEEGRCLLCGTPRPMSIHGLLPCPHHPNYEGNK